ncbi:hypothetical protein G6L67_19750 [Agrobacterium tumefaciens]|uniref:hypothetical protein n=1 Tax=Agrobacterium tumefaciens TaxID=358 RepID=UPI0009B9974D|nr:hypothetical protein [Agrobacterium tumefaciens]NTE94107.1 hypothetical protein [Agrobacterium tumefaciens]
MPPKTRSLHELRLSGFPVDRALTVVRHEIGHWLVGIHHGFFCGDVKAVIHHRDGHYAQAAIELESDLRSLDLVTSYLRRRISVLYAGALAESMGTSDKVNETYAVRELEKRGAVNDHKGVRELLRVLRGIEFGPRPCTDEACNKQLKELVDELWADTKAVLEANHEVIAAATEAIVMRAEAIDKEFSMRGPIIRKIPAVAAWLESREKPSPTNSQATARNM